MTYRTTVLVSAVLFIPQLALAAIARLPDIRTTALTFLPVVDDSFGQAEKKAKEKSADEYTGGHLTSSLKTKHDTVKNSINNIR